MSTTLSSTPREDGFRMPGEFEPHEGCWMLWPERGDTWRLGAKPAQACFVKVAEAICAFEPVTIGVNHRQWENARAALAGAIQVVEISSNDAWMRDVGPTFVVNNEGLVRGVDWEFNAWGGLKGGLYFPWDQDLLVARKVLEIERLDRYSPPLILEGGSIHVDGDGTLITTEECLLNPNRNPGLSKQEIENHLKAYLSVEKIIWLNKGVYMDETDGHVDNLCCFVKHGVIVLLWTDDTSDPQYEISRNAYEILSKTRDAKGRKIEVHKIHQPGPLFMTKQESLGVDFSKGTLPRKEGDRLAGSYVNFYVANRGVIVPQFNDPHDKAALETIRHLYPDREVIGIQAREILLGGGNIHCITQQQP